MTQDIKQIIAQEYIKCAKDPAYFMKKYCYIQHPKRGRILFNLYPFQEKVLHLFRDNQYIITLKSRQLGISTLAAGYSLWLMLFHKDKNILALATTQETAKNLVTKVIFMYEELPKWLKLPAVENNKLSLRLKNGSRIKAKSSNADAARSEAVSLLLIDEAAFIDNIEETFTAAQQTLACIDGKSLILTDSGLKRIESLATQEQGFDQTHNTIYNRNNQLETSTHTYVSPLSKPLRITFDNGAQHTVTKEHQLLNTQDEWIEARNLKIGDSIKGYYNQQSYGTDVDFHQSIENQTKIEYRSRTLANNVSNIDISYWIGLYVAEGSYSKTQVQIANGDSEIVQWLELLGFKNKVVPDLILQASKQQQVAFLQGLFDGDGHITPQEVGLTSTSNQLLQDVQVMLLNMGVQSRITKQTWKSNNVVKVDSQGWRLTMRGSEAVRFKQEIGFRLKRKQNIELQAESTPAEQLDTQTVNTVVSIEELEEQITYDLKVPGTVSYIANGLVNHNTGGQCMALSCVTADTYVFTDKGIKQVADFIPSEDFGDYKIPEYSILGVNTTRRGDLFHTNGKVNTKKIKTKYAELEGSDNHKLWACKEGLYGWHRLDELSEGDFVAVQYGMDIWGNNDDVSDFNPTITNNHKNIFKPDKMTPDISYLIGLYLSEGSSYITKNKLGDRVGGAIQITCGDDIREHISKLGLRYSNTDGLRTTISSKTLVEFFEYLGFDLSKKANEKKIPKRLLEMSSANIAAMLSGIFDGDGYADKRGRVGIGLSSETLINQLRIILNNFGILALKYTVSKELLNSYGYFENKFNYDSYRLELSLRMSNIFYDRIGFRFTRKQDNRKNIDAVNLVRSNTKDVIPHSLGLCNKFFDTYGKGNWTWEKKHGLSISNLANKTKRYKTEHISSGTVKKMYEVVKHLLTEEELNYCNKLLFDNTTWVRIDSIAESQNNTYDFSLPTNPADFWDHSVIYNGIVGHQTPNGIGNWFHKTWVAAEAGENSFLPVKLRWDVHPERTQEWRDQQDKDLGPRAASQECDASFIASGNTVIEPEVLTFYEETYQKDPVDRRGLDGNLWIWEYPDYAKSYIVTADVARGDGADFSTFHILETESCTQVAEFKSKISPKEFGNVLVGIAAEYNDALLVVENANIGWATIEQILERGYKNLYYSTKSDQETVESYMSKYERSQLVPGFITSMRTRPLIIAKLVEYIRDSSCNIRSKRLLTELRVFVWKNGKAQAQSGYNDDLVMAFAMGLYIRDTALKLHQQGLDLTRAQMSTFLSSNKRELGIKAVGYQQKNPYTMDTPYGAQDISWML